MVAAVVDGEVGGVAEAYDRYAASVYACCRSMLPEPQAAEAVRDTFIVAFARLGELRDPDRLEAWLHAVARNECLRRAGLASLGLAGPGAAGVADPDEEPPAIALPVDLRGQVLSACADNSPAGRAQRMSAAHRAGPFGSSGFPKAAGPGGPRWWRRARRRPRLVAALAVAAALAAGTGTTMIMTAGGSHRPQASGLPLGAAASGPASSAAQEPQGSPGPSSSPAHRASPSASRPASSVTTPAVTPSPVPSTGMPGPPAPPSPVPPKPTPSPAQGYLLLAPDQVLLTLVKGQTANGFFVLTAANGPVSSYTISVTGGMAGRVTVSPSAGSLNDGGYVQVIVRVTGAGPLTTRLTVEPGNLTVMVIVKVKAKDS